MTKKVLGYTLVVIGLVLCIIAVGQNIAMGACTPEVKMFGGIIMLIIMVTSHKKVEVSA